MNTEEKKRKQKEYYLVNRTTILERQSQYNKDNLDYISDYNHQYYLDHMITVKESSRIRHYIKQSLKVVVQKEKKEKKVYSKIERLQFKENRKIKRINAMTCEYFDDGLIKLDLF